MLPIPYHGNSNKSELDTPSHEEFYLPSPPKGNLSSQSQQSSGLIEEPQFVPFSTADPNRANLLTVIQTCRHQALSLIEFFDKPMKAMVHSAFHTPSLNPSTLDLNPYVANWY